MGYVRNTVYKLKFEDEQYDGLIVRARSAPIDQFLGLAKLAKPDVDKMESMDALLEGFAKALVSWNLETLEDLNDEESAHIAVPATLEGLKTQDFEFVLNIVLAWIEAIASVATPLAKNSNSGESAQVVHIPMEPLSRSQAS